MKTFCNLLSVFVFGVILSGCSFIDRIALNSLYPFEVVMKNLPEPDSWVPAEGAARYRFDDGSSYWMHTAEDAKHVILYFHGNGETLFHLKQSRLLDLFTSFGWTWIAIDYPSLGVGPSLAPSQDTIVKHATDAFRQAAFVSGGNVPISIIGRSLGAAVASQVATLGGVKSLVLISPWTSFKDMSETNPLGRFVSKKFHMEHSWNSYKACEEFTNRTLIVHGTEDSLIPFEQGKKMAECSGGNLLIMQGLGHNDIFTESSVFLEIRSFIEKP